ncbi:MAG: hypothetical protein ACRCUT_04425 [Spirochaetota bacterium]
MRFSEKIFTAAAVFLLPVLLYAQMPGWFTVRDRDGNVFYMDKNLKIHPSGEPDFSIGPVSKSGIEFCLAQADELLRVHRKADALRLLKSVRYLADLEKNIPESGARASRAITSLAGKEKDRYSALSHAAAAVCVKTGDTQRVYNDWMQYGFSRKGNIAVIKRRIVEKENYAADSALYGMSASGAPDGAGFDAVMTVNAEQFNYRMETVSRFEEGYRNRTPDDAYIRETLEQDRYHILYHFKGGAPAAYEGYELLRVQGRRCFAVRVTAPAGKEGSDFVMKDVIGSFFAGGTP